MEDQEKKLMSLLIDQQFEIKDGQEQILETAKSQAFAFAQATHGIAVLSDLQSDVCYIYAGQFGRKLGLPEFAKDASSAFERSVFNNIPKKELVERHIMELRFFHFVKSVPQSEKIAYQAMCLLHFQRPTQPPLPVLHTTRYIESHPNGSVWLGLCTYIPFPARGATESCILNVHTGQAVRPEEYAQYDNALLSKRQIEILLLLSKGIGSKQIADKLNISIHTVNRHRQDILSRLHVTNAAAAVEIGLRLRLI